MRESQIKNSPYFLPADDVTEDAIYEHLEHVLTTMSKSGLALQWQSC